MGSGDWVEADDILIAYNYSQYFDFFTLKLMSKIYRVDFWLFWSPIDLLDKRYYVPTFDDIFFVSKQTVSDLNVQSDSIFYKNVYISEKEAVFNKDNLFFFDIFKYDELI